MPNIDRIMKITHEIKVIKGTASRTAAVENAGTAEADALANTDTAKNNAETSDSSLSSVK